MSAELAAESLHVPPVDALLRPRMGGPGHLFRRDAVLATIVAN